MIVQISDSEFSNTQTGAKLLRNPSGAGILPAIPSLDDSLAKVFLFRASGANLIRNANYLIFSGVLNKVLFFVSVSNNYALFD